MKLILVILLAFVAISKADHLDALLHQKIAASTPQVADSHFATYGANVGHWGQRFAHACHKNELASIAGHDFNISVGGINHGVKPWAQFESLRWGTKLEHLESKKFVSGVGGWSWSIVSAAIGMREGDTVSMRSVYGWAQSTTNQQYQVISWQSCKRKLFKKKCHTEHRNEPRGLTTDEVNLIMSGMVMFSHRGALSVCPAQLSSDIEKQDLGIQFESLGNGMTESDILYNIQQGEVVQAVTSLLRGTATPSIVENVQGFMNHPRSGTLHHGSGLGTFVINLNWTGVFTVTVQI